MKKNGIVNTDVKIINLDDYTSNDNLKTRNNLYDHIVSNISKICFFQGTYMTIGTEIKNSIPIDHIYEKYKKFK